MSNVSPKESEENSTLWRYMGIEKFIDFIQTSSLYFPSANELGDPYEGSITVPDAVKRHRHLHPKASSRIESYTQPELLSLDFYESLRPLTKISCWHINEHESAAMWKLYSHGERESVAVKTTIRNLKHSVHDYRIKDGYGVEAINFGRVQYKNYTQDSGSDGEIARFFCKRECFRYEQEYRALISLRMASEFCPDAPTCGVKVRVDLKNLVLGVFASPFSEFDPLSQRIDKELENAGLSIRAQKSSIDSIPVF